MRWIVMVGAGALVLVAVLFVVGFLRPATHEAVTRSLLSAAPTEVWATLTDWERWGEWHPDIRSVERLPDRDGHPVLMTHGGWGDVPTEILESDAPHLLVTEVDGGAFRGRWTYRLEATDTGTELTITEEGEVNNPFFRAMLIFHNNYETMLGFHRALGQRLGETVDPVRIDQTPTG